MSDEQPKPPSADQPIDDLQTRIFAAVIEELRRSRIVLGENRAANPPHPLDQVRWSDDGTEVEFRGEVYRFKHGQQARAIVRLIKCRRERPLGWCHNTELARATESVSEDFQMAKLFKNHAAIGPLIQRDGRGSWRIIPE